VDDLAITDTDSLNGNSVMVLLAQITQTAMATITGIAPASSGTHLVQAEYSGNALYLASVSTAIGLIGGPAPGFSLSGTAVSVARGDTKASIITLTPVGGFAGTVNLSASITSSPAGARHSPTFTFGSTTPVSIAGARSGTAALTISTTPAAAEVHPLPRPGQSGSYTTGVATLAIILVSGPVARRRKWLALIGMLTILAIVTGGVAGCGGGSGAITGGNNDPGTTAGTYTVTITGTSGATTATCTIVVTVQ
jgi:hypothetical protein